MPRLSVHNSTSKVRDYTWIDGRSTEYKFDVNKKWKHFQDQVAASHSKISAKMGFYVDFIEFTQKQTAKGKVPIIQFDNEIQEDSVIHRYQLLIDIMTQVNDKVTQIDQRQLSGTFEANEELYSTLSKQFLRCISLEEITEHDLKRELNSYLDKFTFDSDIEAFQKGSKINTNPAKNGPFNVFQLNSILMSSKVDRIKSQYLQQTNSVETIRSLIDKGCSLLSEEVNCLKDTSANSSLEGKQEMLQTPIMINQDIQAEQEQQSEEIINKQKDIESKLDQIIEELREAKRSREEQSEQRSKLFESIQLQQQDIISKIKENSTKYDLEIQKSQQYQSQIKQEQQLHDQLLKEEELIRSQNVQIIKDKSDMLKHEEEENSNLQTQLAELSDKWETLQASQKEFEDKISQFEIENDTLKQHSTVV